MTVQEFLSRFDKVKKAGGQWLVCCPGHADSTPSLAVKEAPDGTILLTDHGGCDVDRILAAMGLEATDLFPDTETAPKRSIAATYSYQDEAGAELFQCVRFSPKGFSQRRPDGAGGWIYDLKGVRRVLYRLPELLGQKAIVFVEGEKDADAAWKLGIPATTSPMGAGKWLPDYASQLTAQGVQRVAVIPDNDAPGAAHASTVAAGCQAVGLEVRLVPLPGVPEHGDLSDYLTTRSKDDLLALIRAMPIWERAAAVTVEAHPRVFSKLNWRGYKVVYAPQGITLEIEKLRDDSSGTHGYLLCRLNGQFPLAKTYKDGIAHEGDFNLRAVNTRSQRAKVLKERSGSGGDTDWYGILEEFVSEVLEAERTGPAMQLLSEFPEPADDRDRVIELDGVPILRDHPLILFGDGGSCKSYLALWYAGRLTLEHEYRIGYVDWELSGIDHRERLQHLFPGQNPAIHYIRYHRPLVDMVDDLERKVRERGLNFLVLDSVGYGTKGAPESAEAAMDYFRAVNQIGVGTLQLAHVVKPRDEQQTVFKNLRPFGSTYWHNSARATWYIHRATDDDGQVTQVGLYHQKHNTTGYRPPVALSVRIGRSRVEITRAVLEETSELADGLPLPQRIKTALKDGPASPKELAELLGVRRNTISQALRRMAGLIQVSVGKYALSADSSEGGTTF